MDKRYITPLEMLNIATQHAYDDDSLFPQITDWTI